jgi:hypothetical protein
LLYTKPAAGTRGPSRALRKGTAVLIAMMVALGSVLGLTQAANAAPPGITANLWLDGATYNGKDVVNEGQTLTLRVQYDDKVVPGSTVEFDFDSNVSLSGVPGGGTMPPSTPSPRPTTR